MTKELPMTDRQAALLGAAFVFKERAQRELELLLEGMATGIEGQIVNADVDRKVFVVEVPDTQAEK